MIGSELKISELPKISLHDHLDGGLRPETIIEIANRDGTELPRQNAKELAAWFHESCSGGNLEAYLKTFELTLSVTQKPEDLQRVAREFAEDLIEDGVIYGEVRWAPEQHLRAGMTIEQAVAQVRKGFDEAMLTARENGKSLRVTQILCAMRQNDNSLEVARVALENRDSGVNGFDLAGPEAGFLPDMHEPALRLLAENHFEVTLHAGEDGDMSSVRSAIYHRALRLGHGTKLAEDITIDVDQSGEKWAQLGETAEWVRDREIAIESCPSSNLQTASSPWGNTIADHPFDVFYNVGMRVTVNPDNRLMSDTTLSREIELLVEAFGYEKEDLLNFQRNAAMAAFLPLDERLELMLEIERGFAKA